MVTNKEGGKEINSNQIIKHILETWILLQGFQPSGEWDESSPECVRYSGEHIIWTVQATVPENIDIDIVEMTLSFHAYINYLNNSLGEKLQVYGLELYRPEYANGEIANHLFIAVCV